jgi:hypothetical protein
MIRALQAYLGHRNIRLEQTAATSAKPLPNLFFYFTDKRTSTDAVRAESNGRKWQREQSEAQEDFQARVVGDLRSAGHKPPFLIFLFDDDVAEAPKRGNG